MITPVIGLDFDGTLVTSWTPSPLPGARERLGELAHAQIFIATNQAGPTWRLVTCERRYPTAREVAERIAGGLAVLGRWPELLAIATHAQPGEAWELAAIDASEQLVDALRSLLPGTVDLMVDIHPNCRKPRAGLLLLAAERMATRPREVVYVGDMDTDRAAAESAGMRFLDADAWRRDGFQEQL